MHRRPATTRSASEAVVDWKTGNEPPSKRGRVDHPDRLRRDPASFPPTPMLLDARSRGSDPSLRGRELWSRYKRPHENLFDNDTWNAHKQVYECPTCGIYASKTGVEKWYSPGVNNTSLADSYRIQPGTRAPRDLFDEETENLDEQAWMEAYTRRHRGNRVSFQTIPADTALDAPDRHRIRYLQGGTNNPPPILTCSRDCYMQQFKHNERRNDLQQWVMTKKPNMEFCYEKRGALQHAHLYPNLRSYNPPEDDDLFAPVNTD